MEEYLDIVTDTGLPTGKTAPKSEVHAKGYYHNTAHIWFYTLNGTVLLAQRSYQKQICPGMWNVSVAGHVDAGERIEEAAIREVKEEIGLQIEEEILEKIGVFKSFRSYDYGITDNEFHHTYIAELHSKLQDLTPQIEEVEALKLVNFDEFLSLLKDSENNQHFVASNRDYYMFVLNAIEKKLSKS